MPPYQPLGDLQLRFPGQDGGAEYERALDLDTGVVSIRYRCGDTHFTREIFASAPARMIVIRFTADKPGSIRFAATLAREADSTTTTRARAYRIRRTGHPAVRARKPNDRSAHGSARC